MYSRVRDVVEAASGIIGRQEQREVHLLGQIVQGKQIANGVAVFGAGQTMQVGQIAGIGMSRGGAIKFGFQIAAELGVGRVIRTRVAHRRHGLGADLPPDPLPRARRYRRGCSKDLGSSPDIPRAMGAGIVAVQTVVGDDFFGGLRRLFSGLPRWRLRPSARDQRERCPEVPVTTHAGGA